ncbi:hypothetical protein [Glycomyces buryatensis]|uniref:PE domain-containing protein n=1 Tax=Glycomyces buryatensis TaxID=2570927 RepID=A0A4S8QJ52_9ACTN|nr:hypothetical protein [Glycomyces buryatensis]THV41389.1 hypothetical protein FAB82_11350 [Glycomyces buryatensis]
MANSRTYDPAALERYRQFLGELLEELEGEILPSLDSGTLANAPAFGSGSGGVEHARAEYADFHATTWRNLQYLRGTLHGMMNGLQAAIENGGAVDEWVAARMPELPGDDL